MIIIIIQLSFRTGLIISTLCRRPCYSAVLFIMCLFGEKIPSLSPCLLFSCGCGVTILWGIAILYYSILVTRSSCLDTWLQIGNKLDFCRVKTRMKNTHLSHHVKAHHDNHIRFERLSLEEKLNCHCGSLTKIVGRNPNMAQFPDPGGNERVGHPAFPTLPKL